MAATWLQFEDADAPGRLVTVEADPQTAVTSGDKPGTAVVTKAAGQRVCVVGDFRDVHIRIQAAAAEGHESGAAPRKNTGIG
jgi:hypothetical protein